MIDLIVRIAAAIIGTLICGVACAALICAALLMAEYAAELFIQMIK